MGSILTWLESTAFSTWMRESPSVFAFPAILSCHTVGMGLVAGINAVLALRILGAASAVPIRELKRFMPVMWFGFWLNAISGVALLVAYPTKALTNPVFYLKLALIALAVWLASLIGGRLFGGSTPSDGTPSAAVKRLAAASLVCWAGAITAGRLLAYTYTRLMMSF
ncbi:MAG: hypothetical protein ABW292_24465 [Vicinamibacterales bacterium]